MTFQDLRDKTRSFKEWVAARHRHLASAALVGGFVFDTITLQRIDLLFEQIVLWTHMFISGSTIVLIHYLMSREGESKLSKRLIAFLPIVTQFSFGALFSAFLIFYSRAGTIAESWIFLALILLIIVLNETLRTYQVRLSFQVSVFFFALFSFSIFTVPIITNTVGPYTFALSGVVTLVLFGIFLALLRLAGKERLYTSRKFITRSIVGIFVLINLLYVTNILPPIPLSLKDIGIYHSISAAGGEYIVRKEKENFIDIVVPGKTYHVVDGASLSAFSSVFAPTDIETHVIHEWYFLDEQGWILSSSVRFPIAGGRDGGFRGYSEKTNVFPGKWRVDVRTIRGQLIGRTTFTVDSAESNIQTTEVRL